jgi:hydroxymethylbilane synthase
MLAADDTIGTRESVRETLNDSITFDAVEEERKILSSLGGGCHQAIGCTILRREYGKVTFLRGKTDATREDMTVAKIDQTSDARNRNSRQRGHKELHVIQIGGKNGIQLFDRVDVSGASRTVQEALSKSPHSGILVAKSDAIPSGVVVGENRPVWTAGIATWYSLANRGIWVNGSFDSLGENEEIGTDMISPETKDWIKLTHTQSAEQDESALGTYTLVPKSEIADLESIKKATHIYFSSGSSFVRLLEILPLLLSDIKSGNCIIACGPGNSLLKLRSIVGDNDLVQVAYNFSDFKRQIRDRIECLRGHHGRISY